MIVKTILLGLLSATAAGSVMYFGTLPDSGPDSRLDSRLDSGADVSTSTNAAVIDAPIRANKSDSATNTLTVEAPEQDDAIVKRLPSLRNAIEDKRVERGPEPEKMAEVSQPEAIDETDQSSEKPKKRWLDQYLKSHHEDDASKNVPEPKAEPEPEPKSVLTPEPESELEAEVETKTLETELFEEPIESENIKTSQSAEMLNDIIAAETDGPQSTRYFKIEDGVLIKVDPAELELSQSQSHDPYDKRPASRDRIFSVAFEEAARILKPELRDQAYFGILEYALRQDNFVEAEQAMAEIQQVDMSYTAKSRIAVAFAQKGLSSMAFKTINSVDDPELRDFMRLQVIEAMIAPERLPSQWREGDSN